MKQPANDDGRVHAVGFLQQAANLAVRHAETDEDQGPDSIIEGRWPRRPFGRHGTADSPVYKRQGLRQGRRKGEVGTAPLACDRTQRLTLRP